MLKRQPTLLTVLATCSIASRNGSTLKEEFLPASEAGCARGTELGVENGATDGAECAPSDPEPWELETGESGDWANALIGVESQIYCGETPTATTKGETVGSCPGVWSAAFEEC